MRELEAKKCGRTDKKIDKWKRTVENFSIDNLTRKCPLLGHILAPPEGLRVPELPGVNPRGRPRESGGDLGQGDLSEKNFFDRRIDGRTKDGQTDVIVEIVL